MEGIFGYAKNFENDDFLETFFMVNGDPYLKFKLDFFLKLCEFEGIHI